MQHCWRIVKRVALIVAAGTFATVPPLRAAQDSQIRILSYGYVDRVPHTVTARIDGNRLTGVERIPFLRIGGEISPDGTLVAYDTCLKADRGINVARLDGSDVKRVVPVDGEGCVNVRWSRDGKRLSYPNRIDMQLHLVELWAGIDTQLPYTSPAFGWHSWSPSGDAIVYETGKGGSRRLVIIDLATWRTRELVGRKQFGACEVWAPDWSPAGDRIAFTSCDQKLYVVNADGTGLTLLATSAYAPRWSLDATSLLFLAGHRLMRIAARGGPAEQLGVLPYSGGPFSVGPVR